MKKNLTFPPKHSPNLRVANITLEPRFGGPQNRILQVADRLNKNGIDTIVIIPNKDSKIFLKSTDIYVCSSITEASPMSVWEAMAMEKAIVSTNVGNVKRFIRNGENGFIVPLRDAEAMAEKVSILIEDENLRVKFGKLSRATAVKELDVAICADKHRRFYLEVLNNEGVSV